VSRCKKKNVKEALGSVWRRHEVREKAMRGDNAAYNKKHNPFREAIESQPSQRGQ